MRRNEKISTKEIVDEIMESIRREVTRNGALANESLVYTGAKFSVRVAVNLYSRGDSSFMAEGVGMVGQPEPGDDVRHEVVAVGGEKKK